MESQTLEVEDYKLEVDLDNPDNRSSIIVEDVVIPQEYCDILLGG